MTLQDNYNPPTSFLSELHWLPVNKRINFKIATGTLAYQSLAFGQPTSRAVTTFEATEAAAAVVDASSLTVLCDRFS